VERSTIRVGRAASFCDGIADHLEAEGFGDIVRELCAPHDCTGSGGRPPIDPEVYFKMLMVGYFENIGSERGVAVRCEDSLTPIPTNWPLFPCCQKAMRRMMHLPSAFRRKEHGPPCPA